MATFCVFGSSELQPWAGGQKKGTDLPEAPLLNNSNEKLVVNLGGDCTIFKNSNIIKNQLVE